MVVAAIEVDIGAIDEAVLGSIEVEDANDVDVGATDEDAIAIDEDVLGSIEVEDEEELEAGEDGRDAAKISFCAPEFVLAATFSSLSLETYHSSSRISCCILEQPGSLSRCCYHPFLFCVSNVLYSSEPCRTHDSKLASASLLERTCWNRLHT